MKKWSKLAVILIVTGSLFTAGAVTAVSFMSLDDPTEAFSSTDDPINSPNSSGPEVDREVDTEVTAGNEIQAAINGTVTIYTENGNQLSSQGSGFIYKEEYLLTNHHVVSSIIEDDSKEDTVFIKYADDSWTTAKIVGSDRYTDIAVLDPDRVPEFARGLELAGDLPQQSERVYAVGAPLGYSDSVTSGVVSATGRSMSTSNNFTIPDTIQTDTEIDPGNSGGPLVLASDPTTVVGVNRAKQGSSIGFAISSRMTDRVATSIVLNGEFNHTYVGISARALTPIVDGYENVSINKGIVIADTVEGSPASGVLEPSSDGELEDIIIEIDGQPVSDLEDLSQYLTLNKDVGDEVQLTVYNDGDTLTVTVELADRSEFISSG